MSAILDSGKSGFTTRMNFKNTVKFCSVVVVVNS